ncbi:MAG: DUF5668 domain-containing protein, partial [Chloroflexota bacterium]
MSEDKYSEPTVQESKSFHSRSVFAPIILITAGIFFLLDNLNALPPLNWLTALQFWPLLLIFIGINVLVVQIRPPVGTLLSLLTALAAVGVFGYLLLSNGNDLSDRFGITLPATEVVDESFAVSTDDVVAAEIRLDLSNYPSIITSMPAENQLVSGTIRSVGGLVLDSELSQNGQANIQIQEKPVMNFNFRPMRLADIENSWEIYFNRETPTDLMIDVGNGYANIQIADLNLTRLVLIGGNGALDAALPDGHYDITVDGANGRIELTLPSAGRQEIEVEGGNGGINLALPESMEARVQFDKGRGAIDVDSRFNLMSGDRDRGVYQT